MAPTRLKDIQNLEHEKRETLAAVSSYAEYQEANIQAGNGLTPAVRNFISQSGVEGQASECHSTDSNQELSFFNYSVERKKISLLL